MKYIEERDVWVGEVYEHLEKLLETHECFCGKARDVIKICIEELKKEQLKQEINGE